MDIKHNSDTFYAYLVFKNIFINVVIVFLISVKLYTVPKFSFNISFNFVVANP